MSDNKVTLTFAGDADSLAKAGQKAETTLTSVGKAADKSGKDMSNAGKTTVDLGAKMGHLGSAVSGAMDAFDALSGGLDAIVALQDAASDKANRMARAELGVEQAMNDTRQATRDLRQSQIDLNQSRVDGKQSALDGVTAETDRKQALLDARKAQDDYTAAVKEHGKGSIEAAQALIDLETANNDLNQAQLDREQSQVDASQAIEDGLQSTEDGKAATTNFKTAVQDLTEALGEQRKATDPTSIEGWADAAAKWSPIIQTVVGIVGLLTAAQWLWNAALWASPITWIILTVVTFIAIMILLATQTEVLGDVWKVVWGAITDVWNWAIDGIKKGAASFWDYIQKVWDYFLSIPGKIKGTFASIADFIFTPFRWAFNKIADAWNNTIGRLAWSVPGWVPGIGGNSISAPHLPKFHQGGVVSGALGAETLAVLQAGEVVTAAGGGGHAEESVMLNAGNDMDDVILEAIRRAVGLRGGDPVRVLRSTRG